MDKKPKGGKKDEESLEEKESTAIGQEENANLIEMGDNIYSCAIVYIIQEYLFLFGFLMFFGLLIYVYSLFIFSLWPRNLLHLFG